MLTSWCARTLRLSSTRTVGRPFVSQVYGQQFSNDGNRKLKTSVEPIPRPSKDKDMRELEKEIRNELSVHNRTESTVVHHRRRSKEMVSPRDIEQIVESHVLDSMRKGDFDNLPGFGKPFKEEYENPFMETGLAKINRILISEGYKPSWILLGKEIRTGITDARFKLALERSRLKTLPLRPEDQARLQVHKEKFENIILKLNEKIHKHNLEVPLIRMQKVAFSIENEKKKVLDNYQSYIPADFKDSEAIDYFRQTDGLAGVWADVLGVFKKNNTAS
ncbi:LOW QUALITY PROTEIN: dnaJ homolog subfamily C member 28-like [Pecten maximus]|uniref:LOW QUALITY PROTEIN: dnaJ homolog subfamily C member 28-like n=1 Tax=Pecten maximus TaxID=6579 RepID=UPI00145875D8|nr:LOW QUALITY PROTEIN: dnaJ homolog subfamily C member 28-like [Pecten maximus]